MSRAVSRAEGQALSLPRHDPRVGVLVDERPWGRFEQLCVNEPCTVKILTVEPGHRLSLQRHEQRDELWTVLDAELTVEIGERAWRAQPGEKVWIPRGTSHRVGNPAGRGARILEVAFGHFEECDIERLADDYSR